MSNIILIFIALAVLYSSTIIVPVYCMDSLFSKLGICYWFYNHTIIFYIVLIILLIILNSLVKLIKSKIQKSEK